MKKIGVRSTQLYNLIDHEIIIIPNTMIAANKITNYSEPDNHRCLSTSIGVAYGTDVKKVEAILLEIANNHPDVVHNDRSQAPFIRFSNFGNSSLDFTLWYYVNDIKKMWRVNSELRCKSTIASMKKVLKSPSRRMSLHSTIKYLENGLIKHHPCCLTDILPDLDKYN